MPACPHRHPLATAPRRHIGHVPSIPRRSPSVPAAAGLTSPAATDPPRSGPSHPVRRGSLATRLADEAGSVATEYGLLAVVAATIVAVVLEWATSGGISGLLDAVIGRVGEILGL